MPRLRHVQEFRFINEFLPTASVFKTLHIPSSYRTLSKRSFWAFTFILLSLYMFCDAFYHFAHLLPSSFNPSHQPLTHLPSDDPQLMGKSAIHSPAPPPGSSLHPPSITTSHIASHLLGILWLHDGRKWHVHGQPVEIPHQCERCFLFVTR